MTTATETAATFRIFDSESETWIELTLQPGESKEVYTGGLTDEGYCHEYLTYSHEGDHVRCEYSLDSLDCDGRYSNHNVSVCPLDRLMAVPAEKAAHGDMPDRPEWQQESSGQRDHFAEAANY